MYKLTGLIGVVLVGGVTVLGWTIFGAQDAPLGHSMVPPDTSAIPEGAPIAEVSLPDDLSTNANLGKTIFEAACATCHGENAAGKNGIAPPLVHKIYERNHHGDMTFVMAAQNGVQSHYWTFGNMPKINDVTEGDVKMVVAYVRELQRANGIN